jgi:hypothetical protein
VTSNGTAETWVRRVVRSLVALLLAPSAAAADELELTFDYSAPAECASASSIRSAVARLVSKPRTEPFHARVVIERTQTGFVSRIRSESSAERRLAGVTCDEVVEATAVILALAMSPKAPAPKAAVGAPASTSTAPPSDAGRADAQRSAPERSGLRLALKAGIAGDSSALPRPAFGVSGAIALQADIWTLQAVGAYFLQQRSKLPGDDERGGDLALWTVWPSACGAPLRGWARLELCAGSELGQVLGDGFGVSSPRHAAALWLALLGAGQLSLGLSTNFRAYAALGVAVRLTPDRPFVLDGIATVHEPSRVSGRASLGVEVVF